jgi:O-antigen/teichoic acid export membrane protein/O-antigen ligase
MTFRPYVRPLLGQNIRIPSFAGAAVGSLGAALIAQLVLVVSGIIIARLFGPDGRGQIALLAVVTGVISAVVPLGLNVGIAFVLSGSPKSAVAILRISAGIVILQFLIGIALGVGAIAIVGQSVVSGALVYATVSVVIISLLMQAYALSVLQGLHRFKLFNIMRVIPAVSYSTFIGIVAISGVHRLEAVLIAWSISSALSAAAMAISACRCMGDMEESAPEGVLRQALKFGLSGFLGSTNPLETFRLDQLVVAAVLTHVDLGIYVAAIAFTNFPKLLAHSLGMITFPAIAREPNRIRAVGQMWKFTSAGLIVSGSISLLLAASAGLLVPFAFGGDFDGAIIPMRILVIVAFLQGMRRVLTEALRGLGNPVAGSKAEIASWIVLIPLLLILPSKWGLNGVAISLGVAASLSFLVVLWIAIRVPGETGKLEYSGTQSGQGNGVVNRTVVLFAVGLVLAAASGFVISSIHPVIVLGAIAFVVIILGLYCLRRYALPLDPVSPSVIVEASGELKAVSLSERLALALFYCGMALLGVLIFRPYGGFTASDLLFLAALIVYAMDRLITKRQLVSRFPIWILTGVVLYALGGFLSSIGAEAPISSAISVIKFLFLIVAWVALGLGLLVTRQRIVWATVIWVASIGMSGFAALLFKTMGIQIQGSQNIWGRYSGLGDHLNDLGGMSAIALVPAVALLVVRTPANMLKNIVVGLALCCIVAGLILSGAVAGIVCALASIGVFVVLLGGRSLRIGLVILIGATALNAYFGFLGYLINRPMERIRTVTDSTSDTASVWARFDSYQAGWADIMTSPFIGSGLDNASKITTSGLQVHNVFLAAWYEAGILGLLGMITIVGGALFCSVMVVRHSTKPDEITFSIAMLCSVLCFVLFAQTAPILFQRYGWVSVLFVICLRNIQPVSISATQFVANNNPNLSRKIDMKFLSSPFPRRYV